MKNVDFMGATEERAPQKKKKRKRGAETEEEGRLTKKAQRRKDAGRIILSVRIGSDQENTEFSDGKIAFKQVYGGKKTLTKFAKKSTALATIGEINRLESLLLRIPPLQIRASDSDVANKSNNDDFNVTPFEGDIRDLDHMEIGYHGCPVFIPLAVRKSGEFHRSYKGTVGAAIYFGRATPGGRRHNRTVFFLRSTQ